MPGERWRLAVMFDAPRGDLARLEDDLVAARADIGAATMGFPLRLGIALPRDEADATGDHDISGWRLVDGAIEVTLPAEDAARIPAMAEALRPILAGLAKPGSIEAMAGAMHPMVPVRPGGVFLSLAFRRYPGTSVAQFRDWWLHQHSGIAIPVLGSGLLAYDQVHVDEAVTRAAAEALGVPFVEYDAYDNLTWQDAAAFLQSNGHDPDGMATIAADEVGRIDNDSRRYALMRDLGA